MKIDFKKILIGILVFSVLLVAFSLVYYYTYFLPQLEIKQIELEKQKQEQLEKEREEALERNRQRNAMIKEYKDFFLTQTDLGEDKDWVEYIPTMELKELEELFEEYIDWEAQRLGIPAPYVEQIKRAYPEEELSARLLGIKNYIDLIRAKPSAEAMEDFMRFLFPPEPEEEP